MKTKRFLLATAGSTVDGRTITPEQLQEMAKSYDPKTYAARLNIEHIRGISGDKPFRAYGDVLELSTEEVTVNFNGTDETRLGLYGVFDVTDDAKALNDAKQKMYPSIEIQDNFANKGFSYLVGCALTDSPAAIATERLQFNRVAPGNHADATKDIPAAPLEFADAGEAQSATGVLTEIKDMFTAFAAKFTPSAPDQKPEPKGDDKNTSAAFNVADLAPLFDGFATTIGKSIDGLRAEMREGQDALSVKVKALETAQETTPAPGYSSRPPADGGGRTGYTGF